MASAMPASFISTSCLSLDHSCGLAVGSGTRSALDDVDVHMQSARHRTAFEGQVMAPAAGQAFLSRTTSVPDGPGRHLARPDATGCPAGEPGAAVEARSLLDRLVEDSNSSLAQLSPGVLSIMAACPFGMCCHGVLESGAAWTLSFS